MDNKELEQILTEVRQVGYEPVLHSEWLVIKEEIERLRARLAQSWQPLRVGEPYVKLESNFPVRVGMLMENVLTIVDEDGKRPRIVDHGPDYAFCRRAAPDPLGQPLVIAMPQPDWSQYEWANWAELQFWNASPGGPLLKYCYTANKPPTNESTRADGAWAYGTEEFWLYELLPREARLIERPHEVTP